MHLSTSPNDSTNTITVDRFQLHRVLNGNEECPLEWRIYHGSELPTGAMGEYVTAYADDIWNDALLDHYVVMGGRATVAGHWANVHVAELSDVQGHFLVRLPDDIDSWHTNGVKFGRDGDTILVTGQVVDTLWPFRRCIDARGVWAWEEAVALGPARFAAASDFPWP